VKNYQKAVDQGKELEDGRQYAPALEKYSKARSLFDLNPNPNPIPDPDDPDPKPKPNPTPNSSPKFNTNTLS